jgi:chorismate synthase
MIPASGIRATPIAEAMLALVLMDHAAAGIGRRIWMCAPRRR